MGWIDNDFRLPNMMIYEYNLDKLLKIYRNLESGASFPYRLEANRIYFARIHYFVTLSISKQIYDRLHTMVTWLRIICARTICARMYLGIVYKSMKFNTANEKVNRNWGSLHHEKEGFMRRLNYKKEDRPYEDHRKRWPIGVKSGIPGLQA